MNYKNKGSWDARTYDQVSYLVQYRWGQQTLEWRKWHGTKLSWMQDADQAYSQNN